VVTPDLNTSIDALSGGNQQKALLARVFAAAPKVLILDEPTLGVDIGARVEIYRAMHDLSTEGAALLVFSSDVEEISSQCDRIIVIRNGRIAAERAGGADPHELVQLAAGDQVSTTI
jgi:ribose transport system ATP-binding protein